MPHPAISTLRELYGGPGADELYDEAVTEREHALQAAELAEAAGSSPELVAAALLHDVGHLCVERADDTHHERVGAQRLSSWFPPAVTAPVGLHVAAKRYLCGAEPDYFDGLSQASVTSLAEQGGPMTTDEQAQFSANAFAADAIELRRFDDLAKVAGHPTRPFEAFIPLLEDLLPQE